MTLRRHVAFSLLLITVSIGAILMADETEVTICTSSPPQFDGTGPGYELIGVLRGEAWATRDWTPEEYDSFSFPLPWSLWFKNGPRVAIADNAEFVRSPGCPENGQFSYMNAFDRTFVLVARPKVFDISGSIRDHIRKVTVEKYHELEFASGRTLEILRDASGQAFVAVSRSLKDPPRSPDLPEGWALEEVHLTDKLRVSLKGDVTVLRLANHASYQGPIEALASPR